MKSSILIIFVAASISLVLAMTDQEKLEMVVKIVGECQAKTKATADDVKALMMKQEPSTEPGKCMFMCIMEHIGIIKDNNINKEKFMPWMAAQKGSNEQIADKLFGECNSVTDPNPCESAVKKGFCIRMAGEKHGIDVDF